MFENIYKLVFFAQNSALKTKYRWRNKNFEFKNSIKFYGIPHIEIASKALVQIGENVSFISASKYNMVGLYKPCTISVASNAICKIGNNSGFSGVSIYCAKQIIIGSFVNCGGNVMIWDTDFHPLTSAQRRTRLASDNEAAPIFIGDDVFIGANSIILKGVTIGNRSIVGAGSVVTKSIPEGQVWAGNPAKFIKDSE